MRLDRHGLPVEALVAVAKDQADAPTIGALARARRSRNLLVLKAVVHYAARSGQPGAEAVGRAFQQLAELEEVSPDAIATVVHHPPVTAWAFHSLRLLDEDRGGEADLARLAAVVAAAAVRAGAHVEVDLLPRRRGDERFVALPTLGKAVVSESGPFHLRGGADGFAVVGTREQVAVPADPHRTHGAWRGTGRIAASHRARRVSLLLDVVEESGASETVVAEDEPYSADAVPRWQHQLDDAWPLLVQHHTRVSDEVVELVTVLVPLVAPPVGTVSATPNDAFGAVAMTRPAEAVWFALSLAHEVQHVKLTAVTDLFPLLDAAQEDLYYAPWRADPRPTFGLLHGMYAHLGVAGFWHRQLACLSGEPARAAEIEFARWRSASSEVGDTLATGARLTPAGRIFVDAMREAADELRTVPVSAAAAREAARRGDAHRKTWLATNT